MDFSSVTTELLGNPISPDYALQIAPKFVRIHRPEPAKPRDGATSRHTIVLVPKCSTGI